MSNTAEEINFEERKYLSVHRVAYRYDVSVATIWRWVREGSFPEPVRITTGCSRWDIETLSAHEKGGC